MLQHSSVLIHEALHQLANMYKLPLQRCPQLPFLLLLLLVVMVIRSNPSCSTYQKAFKHGDLTATKLMEALCARPNASKALTDLLHNTK